jgi:Cu/Ag efflux protein CusF
MLMPGRLAVVLAILSVAIARPATKKPISFYGYVESIDMKLQTVAIRHGAIPGFMPAMTMDYPVDDRSLLTRLAHGDEISATVYVGDPTLHDVHVKARDPRKKQE